MRYRDFEVRIQGDGKDGYLAEVLNSPCGPAKARFERPFSRRRLDGLPRIFERLREAQRNGKKPRLTAEKIGEELFRSLFSDDVGQCFRESLAHVEADHDAGLRIRLNFDLQDPDLVPVAALPWELLWDASRNDFLSRIQRTPVVRYLPMRRPPLPRLTGPLKILVVQSSPSDLHPLNLTVEWQKIWETLTPHPEIKVSAIQHPSLAGLYEKLREDALRGEAWHVLHFMGHGDFDDGTGEGCLYFESPGGKAEQVPGFLLGEHLKSVSDVRLVFLNACLTGVMRTRNGQDPFKGTAQALVRAGVPAVIAMQSPIADGAAVAFSAKFYSRIAAGERVDAAMVDGRLAILRGLAYDWATPVLFTRVPDGDILGPTGRTAEGGVPAPQPPAQEKAVLRLGIRSFPDTERMIVWGEEMDEECEDILDLREFFEDRYIKEEGLWESEIVPKLREFLKRAQAPRRPLHLNFAAHSSIAFAAGYFLSTKSGLEITLRQRGQAGVCEWRALAGTPAKKTLLRRNQDFAGEAGARDVAVALGITRPVIEHVERHLASSGLAVHRVMPATLAPAPSQTGVRDGLHAMRLAEVVAQKLGERPAQEAGGVVHLFAAAPNALLFFLGQLSHGLGRIQLYEYDFGTRAPGTYSPSILLPPASES